jgi:hypothetical protein
MNRHVQGRSDVMVKKLLFLVAVSVICSTGVLPVAWGQCDWELFYTFDGEATDDWFGNSVSAAGDVNNDGYDDLIVGASGNDAGGDLAGRAYVYCGQTAALLWTFTGEAADDNFGNSVSGAGDVNNDGYDDLIVGALYNDAGGDNAGRAYVYSGQTGALLWIFTGGAANDNFGYSVSGAGDVNNDGYDDLIVGAYRNDAGGENAGQAYVYSGQTGVLLWIFTGGAAGDHFGYSVSGAGDADNDGYDDLIVGAPDNDAGGDDAGRAYVYSGQTGGLLWTLTGQAANDHLGGSVSGAGDVNNDGHDDLILGVPIAGGGAVGRAYVYSGQTGALLWTFTAGAANDGFGNSVSGAGDVNNDGYDDLIVGAHKNNTGGTYAGQAYVYSGQTGGLLCTFTGEVPLDEFGISVSGAGDVNNDGYDDLIVGAFLNDAEGYDAGRAYVYSGHTGVICFTGEAVGDSLGFSVSGAGDVNNDGYDDLIVGANGNDAGGESAGRTYVYSGQTGGQLWIFTGEAAGDNFGNSVSGAGDVDNDGYDDLIVGAHFNDAGGENAGRAYVYSGQTSALLRTFTGEAANDYFGRSVSGAGDVNDDGYDDLIVGAPQNDAGGTNAGRAYVYSGQTGDLLWTFTAEAAVDWFGRSVSGAGDVNNDGYDDLIVGADANNVGGDDAGRAYVYSGQTGGLLWTFTGEASLDHFGRSVSGAGDVNDDGYDDLIVGAYMNDAGGSDAGRAYVYSGQTGDLLLTFTGEAEGDRFGNSVSGAGDVNNDGYVDLIVGAYFNDAGGSGAGRAYVFSGRSGSLLCTFDGEAVINRFGFSVSGAGDVNNDGFDEVIVGAHGNDAGGSQAGRAYVCGCQVEEPYNCGDVNNDGVVNVGDAIYILNYLFKHGPAPVPSLCVGDVNNDDAVNVGDAIYILNWLFKSGPAPDPNCCTPPWAAE